MKRKAISKALAIGLISSLAITSLVACTSKTETPSAGDGASNAPATTAQTKKTFSMMAESAATWPYSKDWLIWKLIGEKTGVTIDMQVPAGKSEDTINLNVASGNMPDITFMMNLTLANKYGQQGALANILDYKDQMPNFKKWMDKYPDIAKANIAADGKMYLFPNEGFGETNRIIWLYREDIFKKNNLTAPKTYDELYTVLKKLKELYPKSYPLTFRTGANSGILNHLSPNFATNEGYYMDEASKEVKYGPIEDNYKTMVSYLSKFYKEGLIPPDWLTLETKQWQDQMSTDQAFITIDYIGRIDFFNKALRKDNPAYNLAFMAPPAGIPGGKQQNPYTQIVESGMTVSSKSKNVKDVMQFIDFFYSEEGKNIASWGKEGETYTLDAGKKKIKPDYIDVADLRKKTGLATNGTYTWIDYDAHLSMATPELQAAYVEARKYDGPYRPQPSYNEKEFELLSTVGTAIDKNRNESIAKFILGTTSMDDWAKYVDGAKKLGVQQIIDTYMAAKARASNVNLK